MNLNLLVKQFFIENDFHLIADKVSLIRYDGITLFSNSNNDFDSASTSALVAGLWQAAKSLNQLVSSEEGFYDFRLSFDTTNKGLLILPLQINLQEYFLCAIYKNAVNPGKLKRNIKLVKENLETFLKDFDFKSQPEEGRQTYLFKDISDEEIDHLFEFGGVK